ncbi:hypothetical protein EJ07DRAFT_153667 [Lizonia empirigonia]|nr:hypothetical protein EJ07DRAFT_153667 [Lizonia empirigonia]
MCSRGYPRRCSESLVGFGLAEVPNRANRTAASVSSSVPSWQQPPSSVTGAVPQATGAFVAAFTTAAINLAVVDEAAVTMDVEIDYHLMLGRRRACHQAGCANTVEGATGPGICAHWAMGHHPCWGTAAHCHLFSVVCNCMVQNNLERLDVTLFWPLKAASPYASALSLVVTIPRKLTEEPFYQAPSHGTTGRHHLGQATFHVLVDAPGRTAVAESVVADAKQQKTGHGCNCC